MYIKTSVPDWMDISSEVWKPGDNMPSVDLIFPWFYIFINDPKGVVDFSEDHEFTCTVWRPFIQVLTILDEGLNEWSSHSDYN